MKIKELKQQAMEHADKTKETRTAALAADQKSRLIPHDIISPKSEEDKLALHKRLVAESDAKRAALDQKVKDGLAERRDYLCGCGCKKKIGELTFDKGTSEKQWQDAMNGLWNTECYDKMLATKSAEELAALEAKRDADNAEFDAKIKEYLQKQGLIK